MPKYRVSTTVTLPCYTIVEAESEEEAIEKAADRKLGELDNEPYVLQEHWVEREYFVIAKDPTAAFGESFDAEIEQ